MRPAILGGRMRITAVVSSLSGALWASFPSLLWLLDELLLVVVLDIYVFFLLLMSAEWLIRGVPLVWVCVWIICCAESAKTMIHLVWDRVLASVETSVEAWVWSSHATSVIWIASFDVLTRMLHKLRCLHLTLRIRISWLLKCLNWTPHHLPIKHIPFVWAAWYSCSLRMHNFLRFGGLSCGVDPKLYGFLVGLNHLGWLICCWRLVHNSRVLGDWVLNWVLAWVRDRWLHWRIPGQLHRMRMLVQLLPYG